MTVWMLLAWVSGMAWAETADEIVDKAREANQVASSVQVVTMTIVSKKGNERVRQIELRSRRGEGKVSTYLEVLSPSDVAGTKMLMIDHDDKTDEQMVYLPSFSRVNRISGSSRKGTFLGSDFTYEDLDIREAADGTHTLAEETDSTWVIDTVPADSAQYGRVRAHIGKQDFVARKVEFFDPKGKAVKVLEVEETREVEGGRLAVRTKMTDLERGTHTTLETVSYALNLSEADLPPSTFTAAYLER